MTRVTRIGAAIAVLAAVLAATLSPAAAVDYPPPVLTAPAGWSAEMQTRAGTTYLVSTGTELGRTISAGDVFAAIEPPPEVAASGDLDALHNWFTVAKADIETRWRCVQNNGEGRPWFSILSLDHDGNLVLGEAAPGTVDRMIVGYHFPDAAYYRDGFGPLMRELDGHHIDAPAYPVMGGLLTSIAPTRLIDSRPASKVGPFDSPWQPYSTRSVVVSGGVVPSDATAVVLNVTATDTTAGGYLSLWPTGAARPVVSNLNWEPGQTIANSATVKLGANGWIDVYNHNGTADVVLDVVGYYRNGEGAGFTPLPPRRAIDSRQGSQAGPWSTPWGDGTTRVADLSTVPGLPADATSVVVNATVTGTTRASFLTLWPGGESRPLASTLNWSPGQTIANSAVVKLGTGRTLGIYNHSGSADVVLDVVGYFGAGGDEFFPLAPRRIQDSRPGTGADAIGAIGPYSTPWSTGSVRPVAIAGLSQVSPEASAVLLNTTVTNATASSYLTLWPQGSPRPLASSLNWAPGRTIANATIVGVGDDFGMSVFNNLGNVDVLADLAGWFEPPRSVPPG